MFRRRLGLLALLGPGLLLAATGVGAGDLATGAFAGSRLGTAVLWAVIVGAAFKYILNEGLARWQLASGTTFLRGAARHLGRPFQWFLLAYLFVWSFFVGSALISACGVAFHALAPVFDSPQAGKVVFGTLHSAVGALLVYWGGFRVFERSMSVCIALMFVTVLTTAVLLTADWPAVLRGLLVPSIPSAEGEGISWTVALMGGVGGTLTVLCYGYWIREKGRRRFQDLAVCRIDLAAGYLMTALFGVAMVIIGATIEVEGQGAGLVVALSERLEGPLGPVGKWAFLIGAWGAVASSLLGVWQSVPYLFAELWVAMKDGADRDTAVNPRSRPYLVYLILLTAIPLAGLWGGFERMQKIYSVVGALFMPILAAALLYLNGSRRLLGDGQRNPPLVVALLVIILAFFAWTGWRQIRSAF